MIDNLLLGYLYIIYIFVSKLNVTGEVTGTQQNKVIVDYRKLHFCWSSCIYKMTRHQLFLLSSIAIFNLYTLRATNLHKQYIESQRVVS